MERAVVATGVSSLQALRGPQWRPSAASHLSRHVATSRTSSGCPIRASTMYSGRMQPFRTCTKVPSQQQWPLEAKDFSSNKEEEGSSSSVVGRHWSELGRIAILFLSSSALMFAGGLQLCRPVRAEEAAGATVTVEKVEPAATASVEEQGPKLTEKDTSKVPKRLSKEEEEDMLEQLTKLHDLMEKRDMQSAVRILDKLIEKTPFVIEFRFIRGHAYEYMGDFENARKEFEAVLELDALNLRALQGLAMVLRKEGKDISFIEKTVQEAVKEATENDRPKDARNLQLLLGQLLTLREAWSEALEHYENLAKDDPTDFRPELCQGLVRCMLGEMERAEKHFAEFEKKCPKTMESRDMLEDLIARAIADSKQQPESNQEKTTTTVAASS